MRGAVRCVVATSFDIDIITDLGFTTATLPYLWQ
jgi:hypothetical protein